MKKQLAELASRRRLLLETIEAQRLEVAEISLRWQKPLTLVDAAAKTVRFMHNHPVWVACGMAAFLAWRHKGITGLAQRGVRLLYRYPSILTFGLKYLSSAAHTPSKARDAENLQALFPKKPSSKE